MELRIIDDKFDQILFNNKAVHPLQSWEWGEARKKMGIDVLRLSEFTKGKLTHSYQISFHPIPYLKYKIGYLPRSIFPSKEVLNFLADYGKKNSAIFIKIEPNIYKNYTSVIPAKAGIQNNIDSRLRGNDKLVKSSYPLFPDWTQMLDLTKTEEELMKNLKSKTRYNIKLAQKKGVIVKEMTNNDGFKIFSKLYFETCARQKYFGHNQKYHQIIFDTLKGNIAHILIAFYNNVPLATYELFYFNKVFYYPYGGTSLEYRNLMASNLLMWEAIKLGKKLGAEKFDMWGSLPPNYDQSHPWVGFTRFKEGYGTEYTQMIGSFDLIINSLFYRFYNILNRLRNIFLSIKRSLIPNL